MPPSYTLYGHMTLDSVLVLLAFGTGSKTRVLFRQPFLFKNMLKKSVTQPVPELVGSFDPLKALKIIIYFFSIYFYSIFVKPKA